MMFKKVIRDIKANKREYVFGALIILLALSYAIQNVSSTELWTHLKAGEWIIQHRSIPHQDIFSYTFQGKAWIDFEWLFQALIYVVYFFLQFKGLVVLQAMLVILILCMLFKNGILFDRGERWITFLAIVFALNVFKAQIVLRPQIFFLLFLSLYMYVLNLYYFRNKNYLYLLPIVQVFWANIHGSFVIGIMVAGLYFSISTAQLLWAHRNKIDSVLKNKKVMIPFAVIILLFFASLLNPYGYMIYDIPLKTAVAQEAQVFIEEWAPLSFKSLLSFSFDNLLWFKLFFVLIFLSFIIRKENLREIKHVCLFIVFSIMAFIHYRFIGVFGVVMAQVMIFNISNTRRTNISRKTLRDRRKWSYVIAALFLSFFMIGFYGAHKNLELSVRKGYYPEGVVQFLKTNEIRGNIFNSFDYGGFLIWHLDPQLKVFIDGRVPPVYSEDFFWLHRVGLENEMVWKKLVKEYDIDIVLIDDKRETGYRLFVKWLDEDPSWSPVAFDDVSVLYLRHKPKFKEIVDHYGFKYFRPGDMRLGYAPAQGNKDFLRNLARELSLVEERYRGNFYIYHSLGLTYLLLDEPTHLGKASEYFQEALAIRPSSQFGHFSLGITLLRLKRFEEAAAELKKAGSSDPNAFYYMGVCYYEMGDFYRAIKLLMRYKKIVGDQTIKEAYEYLGLSYLKTFQLQEATRSFLRARYLSAPTFQTEHNLAMAFFGLKDYQQASQYFQNALDLRPNNIGVLYNLGICYEKLGRATEAASFFKRVTDSPARTNEEEDLITRARLKLQK